MQQTAYRRVIKRSDSVILTDRQLAMPGEIIALTYSGDSLLLGGQTVCHWLNLDYIETGSEFEINFSHDRFTLATAGGQHEEFIVDDGQSHLRIH